MAAIIGYSFYGLEYFSDDSTSLQSVKYAEFSDAVIDEIDINQDTNVGMTNTRDTWNKTSVLIASFKNSLEAGNIANQGVKIVGFKVLRRLANQTELDDIFLGQFDYSGGNADFTYVDVSQPNSDLIYSIVPIGENGLDGSVRKISAKSDFTGYWIVDKDTSNVLAFDKALNSVGNVDITLNENRTQIETFSQFPQFYYGSQRYETFTLSTVILPDDGQRSGDKYKDILNKFVVNHKPVIVKSDTGRIFVANISNVKASTPLNTWNGYDYIVLSCDVTEIMSYEDYMKGV